MYLTPLWFYISENANCGWNILLTIWWVLPNCMYIKFMQRPIKWLMGFDCRGNEPWQMRRHPNEWTTSATEPESLMEGDRTLRLYSKSASSAAIVYLQRWRIIYLTGTKSQSQFYSQFKFIYICTLYEKRNWNHDPWAEETQALKYTFSRKLLSRYYKVVRTNSVLHSPCQKHHLQINWGRGRRMKSCFH